MAFLKQLIITSSSSFPRFDRSFDHNESLFSGTFCFLFLCQPLISEFGFQWTHYTDVKRLTDSSAIWGERDKGAASFFGYLFFRCLSDMAIKIVYKMD
uniref:AlNc14C281G10108 protein n=1 Tax=Albugo laibachii Nc14 TaxID=890382 RepID=F0WC55_9STRA|nr:AlNc14C55G4238 [Albugo laibachii Nc14]CCA25196.1 AlNc14C281G10108 [Albugo laibachii Nc14]|eukprot:CCA25196.1 AlNc14C281G10108 [Albugo laibachii Nc14]